MRFPSKHSGVYVFRDERNVPTILAYHRLKPLYLILLYQSSCGYVYLTGYDIILDCLPVDALKLDVLLRLTHHLHITILLWKTAIFTALSNSNERLQ